MKIKDLKPGNYFKTDTGTYLTIELNPNVAYKDDGIYYVRLNSPMSPYLDGIGAQLNPNDFYTPLSKPEFKKTFQELNVGDAFIYDGGNFRKVRDPSETHNALEIPNYQLHYFSPTTQIEEEDIPF